MKTGTDWKNRTCAIYGLRRSSTTEILYVGQTFRPPESRLRQHLNLARRGRKGPLSRWISKVIAEGGEIVLDVLEIDAPWNVSERKWISKFRADGAQLLNLTSGGQGSARVGELNSLAKLTEADVAMIRASKRGPTSLAAELGVSNAAICCARSAKSWAHVDVKPREGKRQMPLYRFFDGTEPSEEILEIARRYSSGAILDDLAAEYRTTRPTLKRALDALGVPRRKGGAPVRPLSINGRIYPGVLAAMKGEHIAHKALLAAATFL